MVPEQRPSRILAGLSRNRKLNSKRVDPKSAKEWIRKVPWPHLLRPRPRERHECLQAQALVARIHKHIIAAIERAEGHLGHQLVLNCERYVL